MFAFCTCQLTGGFAFGDGPLLRIEHFVRVDSSSIRNSDVSRKMGTVGFLFFASLALKLSVWQYSFALMRYRVPCDESFRLLRSFGNLASEGEFRVKSLDILGEFGIDLKLMLLREIMEAGHAFWEEAIGVRSVVDVEVNEDEICESSTVSFRL